jgi:putative phosphoribosyl transferase
MGDWIPAPPPGTHLELPDVSARGVGGSAVKEVSITCEGVTIEGTLDVPVDATGVVVFAHGSGSGRYSPRNRRVAVALREKQIAALLLDLLTGAEDASSFAMRFDIRLLTRRLSAAARFVRDEGLTGGLPVGLFGASTGAASALRVAAAMTHDIAAVVSRGGRPDLAGAAELEKVTAPTLLIVGGEDHHVLELNREALGHLGCEKSLVVVPGATHLFLEPGKLEEVSRLAGEWFTHHFR